MDKRTSAAPQVQTYIVTEDLSILVPRWCEARRSKSGRLFKKQRFYDEVLAELHRILQDVGFKNHAVDVVTLPRNAFDDLLHKRRVEEFWISLDDVYPDANRSGMDRLRHISITRYVDSSRNDLGHGPRPEDHGPRFEGDISLEDQIRSCAIAMNRSRRKSRLIPVLVDDGTFEGGTLCRVLDLFAEQDHYISSVKLGVAKEEGLKRIAKWVKSDGDRQRKVSFIGASKFCPPLYDWVCQRDFFPGVLYAGKVVAKGAGDHLAPIRVGPKKMPVRMQYIEGWGTPSWAKIPSETALPFTLEVLELTIMLWTQIEKWLGTRILIGDLPAVPNCAYSRDSRTMTTRLKQPWISFLKEEHAKLRDKL